MTADVMEAVPSPRLQELTTKLQAAVRERLDWWTEYVQSAVPGEPLEYHPNLGLSKDEYDEFLRLSNDIRMEKVAEIEVELVRLDSARYEWNLVDKASALHGVIIDVEEPRVSTALGDCTSFAEIRASDDQRATGPWNGLQCQVAEVDPTMSNGRDITFALGQMVASERGILYYQVRELSGGELVQNSALVLQYPLPR